MKTIQQNFVEVEKKYSKLDKIQVKVSHNNK